MNRPLAELEEEIRHQDRSEPERLIDILLLEIDGEADMAPDAKWLAKVQPDSLSGRAAKGNRDR